MAGTTEAVDLLKTEASDGEQAVREGGRPVGRLAGRLAGAAVALAALAGAVAWIGLRGGAGLTIGGGEEAVIGESADGMKRAAPVTAKTKQTKVLGPFGEIPGPAFRPQDYIVGAIPKYMPFAGAHMGTPPVPPGPKQWGSCGSGGHKCGSSCCGSGSICCNADIGLCCAGGGMCCYRKVCCSESVTCARTRAFGTGIKYHLTTNCGGGAQFRRLSDAIAHRQEKARMLAMDEKKLGEYLDPNGEYAEPQGDAPN